MTTFRNIKPRDLVTFRTPQGQTSAGRAQLLLCFPSHVVVNVERGPRDRIGRPVVVNASNYVSHKSRRA